MTATPALLSVDRDRQTGGLEVVDLPETGAGSGDDGSLVPHPESESNPTETLIR